MTGANDAAIETGARAALTSTLQGRDRRHALPEWRHVLAVVAHPDDESFGLGAVLDAFIRDGATVDVLCFTQGEASTLGEAPDLATTRAHELAAAARVLGARSALLRAHPDGMLADVDPTVLDDDVVAVARAAGADGLLVFDETGITGHPDHVAATRSAIRAAEQLGMPVLGWTLDADVAERLRAETGAPFVGRAPDEIHVQIGVQRERQRAAIACHASQAVPTSVLWRRLELQGDAESLRRLDGTHRSRPTDHPR